MIPEIAQGYLHYAASVGATFPVLRFLTTFGCDLMRPDSKGVNLLTKAVEQENKEFVTFLLDKGVEQQPNSKGKYPIHIAAENDFADIVDLLIYYGSYVDCYDNKGYTPLHIAAKKNSYESAILLLEAGASLTDIDNIGRTPMHYAAMKGYIEMVELFYDCGADPEIYDNDMKTAVNLAYMRNRKCCIEYFNSIGFECENSDLIMNEYGLSGTTKRKRVCRHDYHVMARIRAGVPSEPCVDDDIE